MLDGLKTLDFFVPLSIGVLCATSTRVSHAPRSPERWVDIPFLFAFVSAAWASPFPEAREFYFSAAHAAPLTVPDPLPSVYSERRGTASASDGRLRTEGEY